MKKFFTLLAVLLFSVVLFAQNSALVVKQEGLKVYLDTTELSSSIKSGDSFTVTRWGEEIKNPQTGKVLGRDIEARAKGTVQNVEQFYAIGQLENPFDAQNLYAVFDKEETSSVSPRETSANSKEETLKPLWQSEIIEGKIRASASGDLNGDGLSDLILAFDDNTVKIYSLKEDVLKEELTLSVNPLRRIISMDAADVKGVGSAQLFISVFDTNSQRFNTLVYEGGDKSLHQNGIISGIVKGISPFNQKRRLYVQEVNSLSGKTRQLTPGVLVYEDNAYKKGEKVKYPEFDNIFGFNFAPFKKGKENLIYTAFNSRLRVQYDKKKSFVESPKDIDFGSTPTRVKVNRDVKRIYSSLGIYQSAQEDILIAGIENQTKYGILSETFGSYESAILYILKWNKGNFEKYLSATIPGVVSDIIQSPLGSYENVLIVPFTNRAGDSGVMLFEIK
jgi:hypothetical protein